MSLVVQKDDNYIILNIGSLWYGDPSVIVSVDRLSKLKVTDLYKSNSSSCYFNKDKQNPLKFKKEFGAIKNPNIKYLFLSKYSELDTLKSDSPFIGYVSYDSELLSGSIEVLTVEFNIDNVPIAVSTQTSQVMNEYQSHSAVGYEIGHSNVVNDLSLLESNSKYHGFTGSSSTYTKNILDAILDPNYDSDSKLVVDEDKYSDHTISFKFDNELHQIDCDDTYIASTVINYNLIDLLSSDYLKSEAYKIFGDVYDGNLNSLNSEVRSKLFNYSFLIINYPIGISVCTFIPIDEDWNKLFLIVGGSNYCRYNRIYLLDNSDKIIDKDSLESPTSVPTIRFYMDSIYMNTKLSSYVIIPTEYYAKDLSSDLGTRYYKTEIEQIKKDTNELILSSDFFDLSNTEYVINDLEPNDSFDDSLGIRSGLNIYDNSFKYSESNIHKFTVQDIIDTMDAFLIDESEDFTQIYNNVVASYLMLFKFIKYYGVNQNSIHLYDAFVAAEDYKDPNRLLIGSYGFRVLNQRIRKVDKILDNKYKLYRIECSNNLEIYHYKLIPKDEIEVFGFLDGTELKVLGAPTETRSNSVLGIKSDLTLLKYKYLGNEEFLTDSEVVSLGLKSRYDNSLSKILNHRGVILEVFNDRVVINPL